MVLRAALCSSGRLALRTGSRCGVLFSQPGLARNHPKMLAGGVAPLGIAHSRSLWWSRTPSPGPVQPDTTPLHASDIEPLVASATVDASQPSTAANDGDLSSPDTLPHIPDLSPAPTSIPPLQPGEFYDLGLIHWWSPAGWVRYSFEVLHTSTGLPWFYVIVLGSLAWRLLALPLGIIAVRNASRLRPFAAEMSALDDRLSKSKDRAVQLAVMLEKKRIQERAGVGIGSTLGVSMAQIVLQLGTFLGVRGIISHPVQQLRESGVSFLPDLTVSGSHYGMPLLISALVSLQMTFQKRELDVSKRSTAHIFNGLRIVSLCAVPFMSIYPDGLWLSVAVGVVVSVMQTRILQIPSVRARLGILPVNNPLPPVTMLDTARHVADGIMGYPRAGAAAQKPGKLKGGSRKGARR